MYDGKSKYKFWMVLLGFVGCFACSRDPGANLRVPEAVIVGVGLLEGDRAEFDVVFENVSSHPIAVTEVDVSCGCISVENRAFPVDIPGGGKHTCTFVYDTKGRVGDTTVPILAHCHGKYEFHKVVHVKANVQPAVCAEPSAIAFDGTTVREVMISLHPSLAEEQPIVRSSPMYVETEVSSVAEAKWGIKVALLMAAIGELPPGRTTDMLEIAIGNRDVRIPLTVNVEGTVVTPRKISLVQAKDCIVNRPVTIVSTSPISDVDVVPPPFVKVVGQDVIDRRLELDLRIDVSQADKGSMIIVLNETSRLSLEIDISEADSSRE